MLLCNWCRHRGRSHFDCSYTLTSSRQSNCTAAQNRIQALDVNNRTLLRRMLYRGLLQYLQISHASYKTV
jgi:hypothetical protein